MAGKKVLIVGGVAGGASAAARLRRLDEDAHIVLFERDPYISFANCGLPYYIGGAIADRSKLLVQTPEGMRSRFNIDVRTGSEVVGLDPASRTVSVRSAERGEYTESYDAVILSPGAKPVRPPLPGIESSRIYTLRNIPDTDRIKAKVTEEGTRSAIVIGGGFIGVEMAESLREAGLTVSLVEAAPQILAPFDAEMTAPLAQELESHGISLHLSEKVERFADTENGLLVRLASGKELQAEMALLAIGVAPDTAFLKKSGLAFGPRGHILVNERMETNLENVYAVGDAIEVKDFVNGSQTAVPLAGPANKQGRIAADNVCGLGTTYKGSQGTAVIKVFGMTGASTGNNEKTLQRLGIPYQVVHVHPGSHAGYYPGATPISLKLLFGKEGQVLGAQATGYNGVEKRIDDIATVIRLRGTVADLTELELSYAPPYSSAKDPVNMAAYAAENVLAGLTNVFTAAELAQRDAATTMLIDVRTAIEHANGHIPGSVNIPVDELRGRLQELDPSKEIWIYCQVGLRGYTASRILAQKGFRVRNLTGGYKTWQLSRYTPGKQTAAPTAPMAAASEVAAATAPPRSDSPGAPSAAPSATIMTAATAAVPETAAAAPPAPVSDKPDAVLDACGLCCPGPLLQVKKQMDGMKQGQILKVTASDPGFYEDIQAWARMTRNPLESVAKLSSGLIEAVLRKGNAEDDGGASEVPGSGTALESRQQARSHASTMVVFSGDLDKAIASFIIANGAAASGKKVTMFFTFWGLNIIRRPDKLKVKKDLFGALFGAMLPRGSRKLGLSRMNMLGAGPKMIRQLMRSKNVSSLEELIQSAREQGVEMVACQMSMDLMGISREELIDGVQFGGVGHYLGRAELAGHHLFI
ncbi:FAD-dependent oxidoreductase [Cohnella hongkongensis]|uniref:FAD-dependent oxidoreductase n=1 Tax=Cohnella hongkongensis TaxID=178337 RepID=A0ABV9FEY7_9BACL